MFKINVCNLENYNSGEKVGIEIEMPMCSDELEELLSDINENGNQEMIISNFDNTIGYHVGQHDNIIELNEEIEELEEIQTRQKVDDNIVECILEEIGNDISQVVEIIRNQNFMVYPNVENNYQLGERLVENDVIGEIPNHLKDFIDYEKIGKSYEYSITIFEDKKIAFQLFH